MIATIARTLVRCVPSRIFSTAAVLIGIALLMPAPASAVSSNVRNACVGDYLNFCAGMEIGSKELRRCFNRNGAKLSSGCVSALISAGEVSQAEVNRRGGKPKVASLRTKKKKAVRTASRGVCAQGPARAGARNPSACKGTGVAYRSTRSKRMVATLR
jgi:hypothetical protein